MQEVGWSRLRRWEGLPARNQPASNHENTWLNLQCCYVSPASFLPRFHVEALFLGRSDWYINCSNIYLVPKEVKERCTHWILKGQAIERLGARLDNLQKSSAMIQPSSFNHHQQLPLTMLLYCCWSLATKLINHTSWRLLRINSYHSCAHEWYNSLLIIAIIIPYSSLLPFYQQWTCHKKRMHF